MAESGDFTQWRERPDNDVFSDFVAVPKHMKGYVIGKQGSGLQEIMQKSGARVLPGSIHQAGFTVIGNERQIEFAGTLILEIVEDVQNRMEWELVDIEDKFKRLVIGKQGAKLREINDQSGAKVIRKDGELYIILGSDEQRKLAKMLIGNVVSGARMRGVENKFNKWRYYIDGCNLQEDGKLKVEEIQQEKRMVLPESRAQYNLIPVNEYESQKSIGLSNHSSYESELKEDALDSLRKLKEMEEYPKADMWCHFGTGVIRVPEEEAVIGGEWSIEEATEKLESSGAGNTWKMAFREGVDLDETTFKENDYAETVEDIPYVARYDLSYLTPRGHQLRCKVWVAQEDVGQRLQDIEIPFSDVKNILEEIHFADKTMRSRCRGWLVLKSRKYLQADILFPGCKYDCTRITIRGRTDNGLAIDYVPEEQARKALSTYLSQLTLTGEEGGFGLRLPENLPEGFHLTHRRLSKRTLFNNGSGFAIILSKEHTWRNVVGKEEYRQSTDLHIHCEEWDRLLGSGVWEPEAIVRKIPEFLAFVKEVQGLVVSKESGLASTVPPEILARGPSAVDAYNKALADGKTSVKRVPIMLIGQDRAGKTSLKKSLKGICFDSEEDSTIGIDVDPSHFKVTKETWRTGTKKKDQNAEVELSFDHHAAMWIVDNIEKESESSLFEIDEDEIESSSDFDVPVIPKRPGPVGETRDEEANVQMPSEPEFTVSRDASQLSSRPSEQNQEPFDNFSPRVPEAVATVTEKLLQGGWEDSRNDIYSTVWDFAGQSVYYETHPLFLTRRAIYCLVYNLGLNPSDKAKPVVKQGVYKKYQDSFNLKTNLDYLDFWMTSVASLASNQSDDQDVRPKSEVLPYKLPAVFLVCTHADKPCKGRDAIELAREIFGCLKSKPYGAHLHDFFVVDNTKSGTEPECLEVERLRQEVFAVAKDLPHINETIPIKWLKFDQAINALKVNGSKYISLEVAKGIASTGCNIKEDKEAKTLIDYLHDLRSLIHFDDSPELNKLVVLDPQWLIDVFKKVITVRPYDCKEKKFEELWYKLERDGILEEELLAHVWGPLHNSKESYESLARIMEKFSLLCPWPSETSKSFLVPSMLKTRPQKKVTELVSCARLPSLFINFASGLVPPGLFHRFVLQFFQWGSESFLKPIIPHLFRNFVRFVTAGNEVCSVIFVCHNSSLEVVIVGEDNHELAAFACAGVVCTQVGLMLESMRKEFHWLSNMRYEMSFLCPVCCQGRAIDYCRLHDVEGCSEEHCLHFWTLSELCSANETVTCPMSPSAPKITVHTQDFAPWFVPSGHQLTVGEMDRNFLFPGEGHEEKALALPNNVLESLCCVSNDSKEVVAQFTESLQLEEAVLEEPNSDTKALIRCFARNAVCLNRLDVVKYLREKLPAGTTGPLLPEQLVVQKIPLQQIEDLTHILSGGDEWKRLAEKLGLTPDKIRYLDQRVLNPADAFLADLAKRRPFTVGELYDALCECDFPVLADKL